MQHRVILLLTFLLSCVVSPHWSIASGGCRAEKGISVPFATAKISFRDGSVRFLIESELRYEYVYEADKRYLNPTRHRANKKELFIGLCAPNIAGELRHAGKEISNVSLEFEAEYSYTPYRVRLLLTNGKEYVVEGNPSHESPLVPPHDFLVNKSEGVSAPEVSVFRLLLAGTDADSKKAISAVVYDASEHHDPDTQIVSIQINPNR